MVDKSMIGLTSLISTLAFYDEGFPSYIILLNLFCYFLKKELIFLQSLCKN
jgi:hypothetical protein